MKVTLDLTEDQAIFIRDALIDKSIALRTTRDEKIVKEEVFLDNPEVSQRRKDHYNTLRDTAAVLEVKIQRRN